jgi:ABC-type transporter Mla subunit MlaD
METIVGAIGFTAATTIINSISSLSSNIYFLINHIKINKSIYHNDIFKQIVKTDIEATIRLLQSIITEIPKYFNNNNLSIVIALKNVQEIIAQIEFELTEIHNKVKYNNTLYVFVNLRSYDCKEELDKIDTLINILEKRRDNLFKTLELFKNPLS